MKTVCIAAVLAVAAHAPALAQQQAQPVRPLLGFGATFGGDKLAGADFTDGSSDSVRAGGTFALYAGAEFRPTDALAVQLTIGYHGDSTRAASNGSIRFSRYPLDLLALYSLTDRVRLGGGLELVSSPRLSSSGAASGIDARFKSAAGLVLEGEYLFTRNIGLKARAASIKYEPKQGSGEVDGSYFGVMMNYYFN